MKNLSKLIAHYRHMERMTTRGLAEVLGISSATVNRIERGEMMDAATLARILAWILEIEKAEIA